MESREPRKEKKIKTKSLVVGIILAVLIGGSSLFAVSLNSNPTQPKKTELSNDIQPPNKSVYDSSGQIDITKFVENELYQVPNSCYIVYANSTSIHDNNTMLYFYNDLVKSVLKTPYVNNDTKTFQIFMHMPQTEIYFYNHCKFFDTKKYSLPQIYDPYQGITETSQEKQDRINSIKSSILSGYNFIETANKMKSIRDLSGFYFMNANEVIAEMLKTGVISLDHNCKKGGFTEDSTVYNCSWKSDYFEYETTTGQVLPLSAPPRENSPP